MVASAIPFALAAGFFPAGLAAVAWYLSRPRGLRLAVAYCVGAGAVTVGSGTALLIVLGSGRVVPPDPGLLMGAIEIAVGSVVLALTAAFVASGARHRAVRAPRASGYLGAFGLGLAMWTPSIAYVLALEAIAAARLRPAVQALNLLAIDAVILSMAWAPVIAYRAFPGPASRMLGAVASWLQARAALVTGLLGGCGGTYLVVRGILDLP